MIIFHWQNGRLEYDEDIDPFKGKSEEEVQQIQREKEAKANAQILEMVRYFMYIYMLGVGVLCYNPSCKTSRKLFKTNFTLIM